MKIKFILDKFAQADLKLSILVSAQWDQKKTHFSGLKKTINTIKYLIVDFLYFFLKEKIPLKIWLILKIVFNIFY